MKRSFTIAVVVSVLAGVVVALPAWAVSLDPDPTFGTDGVQELDVRRGDISVLRLDGSQIVGAGRYDGAENNSRLFVTRMDDDGSADLSYGTDGVASVLAPGLRGGVDIEVLADGSAVTAYHRRSGIVVHKWTPDGDLDNSFSGDGTRLVELSIVGGFPAAPQVAIDTQGRIVVAAMDRTDNGTNALVARLLPGGAYDEALSDNGRVAINLGTVDWVDALATDASDRILLGSDYWQLSGKFPDYGTVIRLRGNGSFDSKFSEDGVVRIRMLRGGSNYPVEFGIAGSGVITVAAVNGGQSYGAVRLMPNGSFDTSYGHDGVVSLNCECALFAASVDGGRVAFAGNKGWDQQTREYDWTTIVVRISSNGVSADRTHVDLLPDRSRDDVNAVLIDGDRTLIGGETNSKAFAARLG